MANIISRLQSNFLLLISICFRTLENDNQSTYTKRVANKREGEGQYILFLYNIP